LRKSLAKYLDDFAKENDAQFPERPMGFKNFRVAAFVQNDATKEVLQAVQVAVANEGSPAEKQAQRNTIHESRLVWRSRETSPARNASPGHPLNPPLTFRPPFS